MTCETDAYNKLIFIGVDVNLPWVENMVKAMCQCPFNLNENGIQWIWRIASWKALSNVLKKLYILSESEINDLKDVFLKYGKGPEFEKELRYLNVEKNRNPIIKNKVIPNESPTKKNDRIQAEADAVEEKLQKARGLSRGSKRLADIPSDHAFEIEFGYAYGLFSWNEAVGMHGDCQFDVASKIPSVALPSARIP